MLKKIFSFLLEGVTASLAIYWTLLKIVVPVMIVVRIGIGFDLHIKLANLMEPVMSVFGLPAETALVLVTTLFAGMYGGATVFVAMVGDLEMTVAQATVLTSMMVAAHAIPMEQQIVRRAGVRVVIATLIRLATAFSLGWVLKVIYSALDVLNEPLVVVWAPDTKIDAPWLQWAQDTATSLFVIFWIILFLIYVMRLCDVTGATRVITKALSPFLSVMGISKDATTLTMTGVLLGMMFGGALIIQQAKSGLLSPRTIFLSLVFMSLCHGLIEDTLFALILGGHISGVFFARVLFDVAVMIVVGKVVHKLPDRLFNRYLFKADEKSVKPIVAG